jgi:hypothetical protein
MIVLSVGMPRAGSGWYYNLSHDLVVAEGGQDARRVRERYRLQPILTQVNCNIGALSAKRLIPVMIPSLMGNTFVIKAHAGPTPFARRLIRRGLIKPTYIFRDPRDAMLSAYDYGQRALEKGRPNAFSHLVDFDACLEFMRQYLAIWEAWMDCEAALHTRYEDLLGTYDQEIERLLDFLKLGRHNKALQPVIERYRPRQARTAQKGLHFHKGISGRFRDAMTESQQEILAQEFRPYLERMGYAA